VPLMTDVPKEEVASGVAPGRGCGDSIPVVPTALLASNVVLGAAVAIPAVGHVVIVPTALPEVGPKAPRLSWVEPRAVPALAPTVGIVPGTAAGDVMRIAGALRADVDLTCWAKAELQPNKSMAAAMRAKLRIGASCA
jgi:hypothetical protein